MLTVFLTTLLLGVLEDFNILVGDSSGSTASSLFASFDVKSWTNYAVGHSLYFISLHYCSISDPCFRSQCCCFLVSLTVYPISSVLCFYSILWSSVYFIGTLSSSLSFVILALDSFTPLSINTVHSVCSQSSLSPLPSIFFVLVFRQLSASGEGLRNELIILIINSL